MIRECVMGANREPCCSATYVATLQRSRLIAAISLGDTFEPWRDLPLLA